ncbi:MAG: tetratricopeptide repeat protein [bacterium]
MVEGPPSREPRAGRAPHLAAGGFRLAPWIVAGLAILTYAGSLRADFTLDDVEIVRDDPRLDSLGNLPQLFADDYWGHVRYADHGLYRPTTLATFALERALHGPKPIGYHAVNLALHALASVGLLALLRALFRDERVALASSALFAVHPIHAEAVCGIVGRAEILAFLGILATVAASRRAIAARTSGAALTWGALGVASFLAGATSKESAFVAPVVVVLSEALAPARRSGGGARRLALALAFAAAGAALIAVRARIVSPPHAAIVFEGVDGLSRRLTALRVFAEYLGLLAAPLKLSAEYGAREVPIARSFAEPGVLFGVALLAGLLAAALRSARRVPAAAWGVGFFLLALLPTSNLVLAIGVAKAERILYAPSAGLLAAAAAAGAALTASPRRRWAGRAALGLLVVLFSARAVARTGDWRNNCTLAEATVVTAPDSPIFLAYRAHCLLDAGRLAEARESLDRAFAARRDFPTAHLFAGVLEEREGHPEAALAHDDAVLASEPEHLVALSRSAVLLSHLGRPAEAAERFERWRRADPNDARPWAGLVKAYAESGDFARAEAAAREGRARFPRDEILLRNATVLESQLRARADSAQAPSSGGRTPRNAR